MIVAFKGTKAPFSEIAQRFSKSLLKKSMRF